VFHNSGVKEVSWHYISEDRLHKSLPKETGISHFNIIPSTLGAFKIPNDMSVSQYNVSLISSVAVLKIVPEFLKYKIIHNFYTYKRVLRR
jgi:hypothetical protein